VQETVYDRRQQYDQVQGVYIISVAARVLNMHPQTLRKYERIGLVSPSRTVGMLRLYSEEDIARLRLIKHLVDELGLNLAGVELALRLFNRLVNMRAQAHNLEGDELKSFLDSSVDQMLGLLQGKRR
jgi:MerR family transcriptional regulator/heat shock protein HspR